MNVINLRFGFNKYKTQIDHKDHRYMTINRLIKTQPRAISSSSYSKSETNKLCSKAIKALVNMYISTSAR